MNDIQIERPDGHPRRWRRALAATAAAGGLAAGAVLVVAGGGSGTSAVQLAGTTEDISGPCDEAEHAQDPRCTGATNVRDDDRTTPTTATRATTPTTASSSPAAAADVRSFDAAGAGTITYEVRGSTVSLVSAVPAAGWVVEVEQAAGDEIDLDLRSGTRRVQVDVEWEDGAPRERVRFRDDADDSDVRSEDGQVVRDDSDDDDLDDDADEIDDDSDDDFDDHSDDIDDDSDDDDDRSGSNSGSHDHDDDDDDGTDDNSGRDHPEDD